MILFIAWLVALFGGDLDICILILLYWAFEAD